VCILRKIRDYKLRAFRVCIYDFAIVLAEDKHLPWFVRFTRVCILIPSAIWIVDTSQAVVISPSAHHQIDLLYSMIRRYVESLMLLRDLHRLYRLARCDIENIQQDRLGFAITVDPLYNLVNAAIACNTRGTCSRIFIGETISYQITLLFIVTDIR